VLRANSTQLNYTMQEESLEKFSPPERLKNLRLKRQCNWSDIAKDVGLSEGMVYAVIAGKKNLSDKALHRLGEVEMAAGIVPPPVTHGVSSEAAQHIISQRNEQKKGIAKLRGQVQKLQTQITAIVTTLDEMEK